MRLGFIDWAIIASYFIFVLASGFYFKDKNNNEKDYFLGGRSFGWVLIVMTLVATQISAVTIIGGPGWAYKDGLQSMAMYLPIPIVMWYLGGVLVPFFYNSGVSSIHEYLQGRFGSKMRTLMVIGYLLKVIAIQGTITYVPALVLSKITGINIIITISLLTIIAVISTVMGGIKAAIWADAFQVILIWVALGLSIFLIIKALPMGFLKAISLAKDAGRLTAIDTTSSIFSNKSIIPSLFGAAMLHLGYFGTDQTQVQKMLTAKSMKHLKTSLWVSGCIFVLQIFLFTFIGSLLFVYYKGAPFAKGDEVFLHFIVNNMPTGIIGIMIAAIFSASSLGSALNPIATVFVKDIYEVYIDKNLTKEKMLKISKITTLMFGIFFAGFAYLQSFVTLSVLESIGKYGSYILGSMLGVFLLGIYTKKTNEKGAVAGFLSGFVAVVFVATQTNITWLWYSLVGTVITLVVGYMVSILTGGEKKDISIYTIKGQKDYFMKNNMSIIEDGVYVIPGKFEKTSYLTIIFFIVVVILLYLLGRN
jgi:SSS family solute:Na+ symporter